MCVIYVSPRWQKMTVIDDLVDIKLSIASLVIRAKIYVTECVYVTPLRVYEPSPLAGLSFSSYRSIIIIIKDFFAAQRLFHRLSSLQFLCRCDISHLLLYASIEYDWPDWLALFVWCRWTSIQMFFRRLWTSIYTIIQFAAAYAQSLFHGQSWQIFRKTISLQLMWQVI